MPQEKRVSLRKKSEPQQLFGTFLRASWPIITIKRLVECFLPNLQIWVTYDSVKKLHKGPILLEHPVVMLYVIFCRPKTESLIANLLSIGGVCFSPKLILLKDFPKQAMM